MEPSQVNSSQAVALSCREQSPQRRAIPQLEPFEGRGCLIDHRALLRAGLGTCEQQIKVTIITCAYEFAK